MNIPAVARRYAQALYDLAVEEGVPDAVRSDLAVIRNMIGTMPEFADLLDNPTIPPALADRMMVSLFSDQAHPATLRFLRFIASRGRLNQLKAVCKAYEQRICEDLGILKVKIKAAHELSEAQLTALKAKLGARYEKVIEAEVTVDASLIGGFRIQAGDHIQDLSLVDKLNQFEQSVINARHAHAKLKV
jgi:F-type H+-transporting ATPase subunit delta